MGEKSSRSTSRRSLLTSAGVSIAALSVGAGSAAAATAATAQDDPIDFDPEHSHETSSTVRTRTARLSDMWFAETTSSYLAYGGSYEAGNNVMHLFAASANGTTASYTRLGGWNLNGSMRSFQTTPYNLDPDNASLLAPNPSDDRMIAATIGEEDAYNWQDGIVEGAKVAVSEIYSPVGALLDANDIAQKLTGTDVNPDDLSGDYYQGRRYEWDTVDGILNPDHAETATASMRFYVESDSRFDGYDVQLDTEMAIAPPDGPAGNVDSDYDDDNVSAVRIYSDYVSLSTQQQQGEEIPNAEITDPVLKSFADGESLTRTVRPPQIGAPKDID